MPKRESDVISRREFFGWVGAATSGTVAGCLGGGGEIEQGMHDILVQNKDSRERTITVEVTNFSDGQRDEDTPLPENLVWERDFTHTLMPNDYVVERDIFTGSGWNYIRISLEDGQSFDDWANGCYYSIRINSGGSWMISEDTSSC